MEQTIGEPSRGSPYVGGDETLNRYLEHLPEPVQLATADVSFISLTLVLPRVRDWLVTGGQVITLIKPQFEAGPAQVGRGGVVRDPSIHREVLLRILDWATTNGLPPHGLVRSPVTGPAGNAEFLALLVKGSPSSLLDVPSAVKAVLGATPRLGSQPGND